MLVIRQQQMEELVAQHREDFFRRAAKSLARLFPEDPRHADEEAVRALIADAVEHAGRYGIKREREQLLFLFLAFDQGLGFESRPGQAWIEKTLRDDTFDQRDKMEIIYARLEAAAKRGAS
jgi:hypothetical protein